MVQRGEVLSDGLPRGGVGASNLHNKQRKEIQRGGRYIVKPVEGKEADRQRNSQKSQGKKKKNPDLAEQSHARTWLRTKK